MKRQEIENEELVICDFVIGNWKPKINRHRRFQITNYKSPITNDPVNLFAPIPNDDPATQGARPLADRMRPRTLDEFVGQEHLVGPGKPLRVQIERDDPTSMIFWDLPAPARLLSPKSLFALPKRTS